MHTRLIVWGSKALIQDIANNYYQPAVLTCKSFKEKFDKLLPQPVIHKNHHIGGVCSITPIVGNILLVDNKFLDAPQPMMEIPEWFEMDTNLQGRASEAFSFEILPTLETPVYSDFVIDIQITSNFNNAELLDHFKMVLECISPEHCFAWHILSSDSSHTFYRQILKIKSPEMLTLPRGFFAPEKTDTDSSIFAYKELTVTRPNRQTSTLLKPLLLRQSPDAISNNPDTEYFMKTYWPSKATPKLFQCNVVDFFDQIDGYQNQVIFEKTPRHSKVFDLNNDLCDH